VLFAFTQLLLFQLAGETLARALGLPLPGPVLGMALLFLYLVLRRGPGRELQNTVQNLLQHLSLLFVPAGTGVMLHMHLLAEEGVPILVSLALSTLVGMAVAALLMKWIAGDRSAS